MLIERNLAPALLLFGGALVLPGVSTALRHAVPPPSAGAMITGNGLAALGLFMAALLMAEVGAKAIQLLLMSLLALLALAFTAGTVFAALQPSEGIRWFLGASGLLPLLGAGGGLWGALKR